VGDRSDNERHVFRITITGRGAKIISCPAQLTAPFNWTTFDETPLFLVGNSDPVRLTIAPHDTSLKLVISGQQNT